MVYPLVCELAATGPRDGAVPGLEAGPPAPLPLAVGAGGSRELDRTHLTTVVCSTPVSMTPEFEYRPLADEVCGAGPNSGDPTVWRTCSDQHC